MLVSLGTFLSARDDVLTAIAHGLRQLDVRGVGHRPPTRAAGPMPSELAVSILRRASVLVTHAGNNSVTEALAHGVPMLTLPFSSDQFDGAAAIEAAHLGLAADPNRVTPLELAEAVRCVIGTFTRRWTGWRSSLP